MKTMQQMFKDWGVAWFLEQFGLWANQPPELRLGYPKMSLFAQMQGRSIRLPEIDDETAVFIQESINRLGERHPLQKELVVDFYVRNRTFEKCANAAGMNKTKAYDQIRRAESWIDSKLDDFFKLSDANRKLLVINIAKNQGSKNGN